MTLNVLGTDYEIIVKKYDEEESFGRCCASGFCDSYAKQIVCCDMATYKGWEHDAAERIAFAQKQTLRHEIVHAFFYESGLNGSALNFEESWAANEEMVDWIAWQGPKIYRAWQEAGAL